MLFLYLVVNFLPLCILETSKLWQILKTKMTIVFHFLLRLKQLSGTEIYHNLETFTCDPLKYKMGNNILIVSICIGKSISIQRINVTLTCMVEAQGMAEAVQVIVEVVQGMVEDVQAMVEVIQRMIEEVQGLVEEVQGMLEVIQGIIEEVQGLVEVIQNMIEEVQGLDEVIQGMIEVI